MARAVRLPSAQHQPAVSSLDPWQAPAPHDGQHDFDFQVGTWNTRLSRRLRPLTGSTAWAEYAGTTDQVPVPTGESELRS